MLGNLLKGIFNKKNSNDIEVNKLPSQGLFYKDGFGISIKKAEVEDIIFYESNYKDDPISTITLVKDMVKKNIFLSKGYEFEDIASIDIVFLFFEIVKLTKGDSIWIHHTEESILFDKDHFNYFSVPDYLMEKYDSETKEFVIDGFKFKLPTIGIETSVTRFIGDSAMAGTLKDFSDKSYDFMYFLGDKNKLSNDEIINLLTIFNDELDMNEREIVDTIIKDFASFNRYTLKTDSGDVVEMGQLDLSKIWE
ncbi:MAG: hypothetical protein SLAVMIC_00156 [uncultured marine phage]|uniref:Uncharacterized protein n=1 Tax=uncultured marine phage TaxID=707152 RepID=A0A8D9CEP7_9VIRU|nr:MAG: hypothetical protein SLAVMIC_00156 [uncultured marine phage]